MAKCPRCGAVNRPGKVACWKCLAPIPPPPPAQPTPHTPPSEPKLAVPFRRMLNIPDLTVAFPKRRAHAEQPEPAPVMEPDTPAPNPEVAAEVIPPVETPVEPKVVIPEEATAPLEVAVEVEVPAEPPVEEMPVEPEEAAILPSTAAEIPEEPAEDDLGKEPSHVPVGANVSITPFALADDEDAPDAEDAAMQPARSFIYIAGAAIRRKDRTWISVMVVLTLLIAGIFILYHRDFRDKPRPVTPQQAAQEYLFYLRDNDRFSQQQLATPGSKGLELPSWFTITDVQLISVSETGGSARAVARLGLAPTNSYEIGKALASLASRYYGVEFTLEHGDNCWMVDQRTLFRSLRWKMKQANPKLSLPPWDGVSQ